MGIRFPLLSSPSHPRGDGLWRFAKRFFLIFGVIIILWVEIAPLYTSLVFSVANLLFRLDHPPIAAVGEQEGRLYAYYVLSKEGPQPVFSFEKYGLFFNTVFLVSALLATPNISWFARVLRALAGVGLLALVHPLFVVVEVKAQFINLGLISTSAAGAYMTNWLAVLLGPLGEALFPLLIVALLAGGAWKEALNLQFSLLGPQTALRRRGASVSRNAPCPCGSGRKYKYCCGRSGRR